MQKTTPMETERLYQRFTKLAKVQGVPQANDWWTVLNSGYSSVDRHYHDWRHIDHCLFLLDELHHLAKNSAALELAIWFHDAVYDSRRSDNEEQSALLARSCLEYSPRMERVIALIMATTHKSAPADHDSALLCDIDLSILGDRSAKYDDYAVAIRTEYAWVSDVAYQAGRSAVLTSFLARPSIYTTTHCQTLWEEAARGNLERELDALTSAASAHPEA